MDFAVQVGYGEKKSKKTKRETITWILPEN